MLDYVTTWISAYGLIAIFLLMFLNGTISAPPSEFILGVGGIVAAQGIIGLHEAFFASAAGNYCGAILLYFYGKRYGEQTIIIARKKLANLPLGLSIVAGVLPQRSTLRRYALRHNESVPWWLLYCRCLPVIRSVVSVPAGISGVSVVVFTILSFAGISLWAMFWIGVGFVAESQNKIDRVYSYTIAVLAGVLMIVLLRVTHRYVSNQRMENNS